MAPIHRVRDQQSAVAKGPCNAGCTKDAAGCSISYWKLLSYADAQDVVLMVVGSLAAIVSGLIFPAILVVQSRLIDNFGSLQHQPSELARKVSQDATFLVYTAGVALVASYFEVSCWMKTGERQVARMRADYLRSILRQNVGFFDSEVSTADVVGNVSVDTLLVQEAISEKVGNFIENVSQFVGGYLVGFTQIWKLALVMLPFIPLLTIPGSLYSRALSDFAARRQAAYAEAGIIAEQALSSIRTVYSFVAERKMTQKYSKALEGTVKLGMQQGLAKGLAMGSSGINFALWAFMAWYGSQLVTHHHAVGGQVLTTGFAVLSGGIALGNATPNLKAFAEGKVAAYRIFQMIERVPPIDSDDTRGKTLDVVKGELGFKDVEFAYPSRPDIVVLKGFNLQVAAGKTVAMVGCSGSGKSTIISLLERFYDPVKGAVMLDNVDIRDLQLTWYRRLIGLVNQEPGLFATSIKENILYGKEDATMDEVVAATKAANAHEFIMKMPRGYDTQVGEMGVQLSGGQKQRIAIARALIRNPPILLLDEATSALDNVSEHAVQLALENARMERTTVVVAHRLSTIRNADRIVVLESGNVVESGTHDELVSLSGLYSSLLLRQTQPDGELQIHSDAEHVRSCSTSEAAEEEEEDGEEATTNAVRPSWKTKRKEKQSEVPRASLWRLLSLNKPEWRQGLLGMCGAVCFGFVHPFYAFLLGSMVASFYAPDERERRAGVRLHVLAFVGLSLASFVVNLVQHYNFAVIGERLTQRIREMMLETMLRFEVAWFDKEENSTGALCSRLATDASMVRALVGDRISLLVQTASATSVSCIVGLVSSWRLALLIISIQPLIVACYCVKNVCLRGFARNAAAAQREAVAVAGEAVSHHRTVTAFSSQQRVLALFGGKLAAARRETMRRSQVAGLSLGVAQFILYASWGLDFWYGSLLVKQGRSSFEAVLKTVFILVSTGRVLAEAGMLTPDIANGAAAVAGVLEVLDRPGGMVNGEESVNGGSVAGGAAWWRGDVELRDVAFAYPSRPAALVLRGFNLCVAAGTTAALVGESGCGKSSVVALLARFYDPLRGCIVVGGRDIRGVGLRSLRRRVGLVSQEPALFACSIRDNIAFGRDDASDAEVEEAARAANAHSFISALPRGYDTFAGDKGLQLSGGQKQRIAIARAVLKNPAILLLDEATSALDAESEQIVQSALEMMMVGRTTVIIAHRLSTISAAHCIAVVRNGVVVEQGTHDQLLALGDAGAYSSLSRQL